ncbi:nicotinate-nucleotide--dimethylbenzimidazole phosphoribosyltransferase [Nocardioides marmoriginsengisoli]|uniref:Nicotinate-nucleotide--dimethylbenzimidazole phosphoribosyltransferase n=1 Tax=Nocardioides marmoriginsengisoli TaxID=661483 RepID=A0A3N0CBY7_9ACTN|nr:nicotinate-nucleotide--dimethylbenzimidazole phosphoribosyltransferase [Nocardioides marmoriginsengisoli]RNL60771.1 nicotinate-nucleotide--dimethylbenzimidazole phosphoribosyltransferase [Nocardioides marmoriginsengisoli]
MTVKPPSAAAQEEAADRLAGLATPAGALGRLGELGVWLAGVQGQCPPAVPERVRAVIFAGDHGVTSYGVSAYPAAVTPAMVRTFAAGRAGVSALAAAHGVTVRVLDIAVDDDLEGIDPDVQRFKVRRSSEPLHLRDALTVEETHRALDAGTSVAAEEIAAGAQLLISGDMGIGNTTPATALIAESLGLPAAELTGRGTGIDDEALAAKTALIQQALDRVKDRGLSPVETLAALGGADLAASTGYLVAAARAGVPVLLDGVIAVACAVMADRIEPGAADWFAAGHRSTEPAQSLALDKLGLVPLLDLGMRLGEGSGAVAAVPVVRSAAAVLRDVALLSELAI